MKVKFNLVILTISLLFTATMANAKSKNAWRDCGIGALIFSETKWAAVTSNLIWDLGLTGSTSSSSSPSQCAGVGMNAAKFIYQNYAILEEETAVGEGVYLTTVLNIIGCEKKDHSQVINEIRKNYSGLLKSDLLWKSSKMSKAKTYFNYVANNSRCAII